MFVRGCRAPLLYLLLFAAGCAHAPPLARPPSLPPTVAPLPQAQGSYYTVQRGEALWRIARDFGWDAAALARANHLSDPKQVRAGQRLFIPPPQESNRFLWPVRGVLLSAKEGRDGSGTAGIQINAPEGSFVRASRTGRVAVAARQLAGWGKTIILDHGDGYVSIYTGLEQLLVSPGVRVQQGNSIGQLGRRPLYFAIRYGTSPWDPLQLLP